jgi:hypothetical protein
MDYTRWIRWQTGMWLFNHALCLLQVLLLLEPTGQIANLIGATFSGVAGYVIYRQRQQNIRLRAADIRLRAAERKTAENRELAAILTPEDQEWLRGHGWEK